MGRIRVLRLVIIGHLLLRIMEGVFHGRPFGVPLLGSDFVVSLLPGLGELVHLFALRLLVVFAEAAVEHLWAGAMAMLSACLAARLKERKDVREKCEGIDKRKNV